MSERNVCANREVHLMFETLVQEWFAESVDDYNDFINITMDIAHYHHENWDGSGYPEGLKHNEIPLAAQIVSLMSRYCILTEREQHGSEEALAIMKEEAGVKFNPEIFEICCKISRQFC